jgi:signal transduction histidine kinase
VLSFRERQRARFRYRLLGLDEQWIDDINGDAVFPNLGYGRYQFQVKAYHPARGWITEPAEISFEVAPLWWQTIWAIGGAILLLACAIVAAWRWRVRVLVAQKNVLAKAVNQRTAEIRAEKGTVEQQKKQIEDLLAEAQRVNRLKDEFLANISHEIRTPLHGVLGMTGLALTTPLSEEQREYLQLAEQSAQSLLHLLNDILDFSKIQAGKLNLQHIPFSLRDCIERSTGAISLVAERKGLEFRVLLAEDLPETVLGDPDRLQQILSNLTNNAVKFTDRGRIQVLGFRDPKPEFKDRIHFSVRDTGQGIPRDKWQVVFEPFRQADGSTTRRFGGTGLGLSICSRLVAQMDGELTLDSEPGTGSTFSFFVSLPEPELPEFDSADVKKPAVDLQPLKVLLIEAYEVNLKVGMRQLDRQGCAVTTVPTGMDALELLGEIDFDLIVMDLQLAGMDGLDLIRKIRLKGRSAKHTPVIVLTSAVSTAEEQSVLKAGADAYLSRPVQAVDLRRVLEAGATR